MRNIKEAVAALLNLLAGILDSRYKQQESINREKYEIIRLRSVLLDNDFRTEAAARNVLAKQMIQGIAKHVVLLQTTDRMNNNSLFGLLDILVQKKHGPTDDD